MSRAYQFQFEISFDYPSSTLRLGNTKKISVNILSDLLNYCLRGVSYRRSFTSVQSLADSKINKTQKNFFPISPFSRAILALTLIRFTEERGREKKLLRKKNSLMGPY